jgi:nucleoside-diphosphate-sugar epimerase
VIKKVGITGAGGLVGVDLTEGLADKYQLTLFYHNTKPTTTRKLKMVKADLSDEKQVKGIFEGLDAVIHLAAASSSLSPWENVLSQNIVTTYNVFEEARRSKVAKVVFASTNHTQHAYTMKTNTLDEDFTYVKKHGLIKLDDPPAPDSLYGVSKLFGEDMGRYYSQFFGIQVVSLRIGWAECEKMKVHMQSPDNAIRDHVRVMYLSKRDLVDVTDKALQIDTDYMNAYAVSDNKPAVFDLTETRENLGYNPKDNAKDWEAKLKL